MRTVSLSLLSCVFALFIAQDALAFGQKRILCPLAAEIENDIETARAEILKIYKSRTVQTSQSCDAVNALADKFIKTSQDFGIAFFGPMQQMLGMNNGVPSMNIDIDAVRAQPKFELAEKGSLMGLELMELASFLQSICKSAMAKPLKSTSGYAKAALLYVDEQIPGLRKTGRRLKEIGCRFPKKVRTKLN